MIEASNIVVVRNKYAQWNAYTYIFSWNIQCYKYDLSTCKYLQVYFTQYYSCTSDFIMST